MNNRISTPRVHTPGAEGESPCPLHEFAKAFTSSPRGARLARRLVSHRLDSWGTRTGTGSTKPSR